MRSVTHVTELAFIDAMKINPYKKKFYKTFFKFSIIVVVIKDKSN